MCSFLRCICRAHLRAALSLYLLLAMKTPRKQRNREQDSALRGDVDHVLRTEGGNRLKGEDVHVLHAEGHIDYADVEALLEGNLEGSPHR